MKAIVIAAPGGPEVLELRGVPAPEPPPGHVRVRVAFVGVNRADLMQRLGVYPAPPGVPADIPGLEYAGAIDAVGAGVTRWRVGQRVFGLVAGGAYAEQLVAHEREVVATPGALTDEQAAAVPEAFVTAYDALVVRGRLQPGERVLISAAGSGVGTAGVQLARALGCTVIGTSRTEDKLQRARALGLDVGIVPEAGAFADRVRAATGGAGVDVVLELVGGRYVAEDAQACAPRGRIVVVGLTGGRTAELDLGVLLRMRLELIGTVLRSRPLEEKIEAAGMLERTIVPWLARRMVRPIVDRVFALSEAGAAHTHVAADASFGKVLLRTMLASALMLAALCCASCNSNDASETPGDGDVGTDSGIVRAHADSSTATDSNESESSGEAGPYDSSNESAPADSAITGDPDTSPIAMDTGNFEVCGDIGIRCDGGCIDIVDDRDNCGHCGWRCDPAGWCAGGSCHCGCDFAASCPLADGGGEFCTPAFFDPKNCGACGHTCPSSAACCVDGKCVDVHGMSYGDKCGGVEYCP